MSNGERPDPRTYLGDGLYVTHDEWGRVQLYASNGMTTTDRVFLDPSVLRNFERWVERARAEKRLP